MKMRMSKAHMIMYSAAVAAGGIVMAVRPSTFDWMSSGHFADEDKYFLSDNGVPKSDIKRELDGHDDLRRYYHIFDKTEQADVYGLALVVNSDTRVCFKAAVIKTEEGYQIHPEQYCTNHWDVLAQPRLPY